MWNPLSTLPQSNAGALAAYSPQVNQALNPTPATPPVMTPPHIMGGQPGLHPLFGGGQMKDRYGGLMAIPGVQDWFQQQHPGWQGMQGDPAQANMGWRDQMQTWLGQRPAYERGTAGPDFKTTLTDWLDQRPQRSGFGF